MLNPRKVLWLPSLLSGGLLVLGWTVVSGLMSCDSTAKFNLPDTKFQEVQVVSTFPALVENNKITRVCGAPLDGSAAVVPNGLEVNVAFVSTDRKRPLCAHDRDLAIKEGELIELTRVKTTLPGPTVGPNNFKMHLDCLSPYKAGDQACSTSLSGNDLYGAAVHYEKVADRCDPNRSDTWLNVAVMVDHSGSVSGLVDGESQLEDLPDITDLPGNIDANTKSDPFNARITAATTFLDSLNDLDRAIAYYFDEDSSTGVSVACSDSMKCIGGTRDNEKCASSSDCPGGDCFDDLSLTNDTFESLPFKGCSNDTNQQKACFGRLSVRKQLMKLGLEFKAKLKGEGRAPLWQGLEEAYTFLTGSSADCNGGVSRNRAIVILTDGPDTCTDSEDFNYKDLTWPYKSDPNKQPQCRVQCANAQINYQALRKQMDQDGWPVQLHFVQFQSPAHKTPDARMQELACRSGGTFQFINSENFSKLNPTDYTTLTTAMTRVRNVLSGSWRVGFTHSAMNAGQDVKPGTMMAVQGSMQFINAKFLSLDAAYSGSNNWRFGFTGQEDRRLLFRRACAASTDCGGDAECGANWCTPAGLCQASAAQDQLPCSKGKCCGGTCAAKCDNCK